MGAVTRPVLLVDRHPDAEQFDALTFGLLTAMAGLAFATLVVGLTETSGMVSTAVLAAGVAPAIVNTIRWYIRKRSHRLVYLRNVAPGWHSTVHNMSDAVNVISGLIAKTPPGPVFDHLCDVHQAATGALSRCVARAELAARSSTPDLDVQNDHDELRALVAAAQRLRVTQETLLVRRPLTDLTERTERIRAALEAEETSLPT